jgi:hypothetical protein
MVEDVPRWWGAVFPGVDLRTTGFDPPLPCSQIQQWRSDLAACSWISMVCVVCGQIRWQEAGSRCGCGGRWPDLAASGLIPMVGVQIWRWEAGS